MQIGNNGEISSLTLVNDAFPTNYVLTTTNLAGQIVPKNATDHWYLGELLFTYRLGTGAWKTAATNQSDDVRNVAGTGPITVTYQNSANAQGVQNFKLVETYSLVNNYLYWQISVTNTSTQTIEFGDVGLPISFNELFTGGDVVWENRVLYHEFTGQNSSYVWVTRPSGVGNFLLMVPDPTTGAAPEYKDNWHSENSGWIGSSGYPPGLDIWYLHSNVIKSTKEGYLPNTSLTLAPNASQTYAFKFYDVASQTDVKNQLYSDGLIDITVVPSLILPTNQTGKIDLHTSKAITSVSGPGVTINSLGTTGTDHHIYQIKLASTQLGQTNVVVSYGSGETTTLQFYGIEPIDAAIQRRATFMVNNTVSSTSSDALYHVFDDWLMDTQARRGATGGSGWGDDWGWTKGEFLAEKNSQTPVAAEVTALDNYLDAIWNNNTIDHNSYVVQDWWCPSNTNATNTNNCFYDRAYAYPHAFNTYFAMYKTALRYPNLVKYHQTADAYLMKAYNIINTLYNGHSKAGTGYMGESILPDIIQALSANGHTAEAQNVTNIVTGTMYPAYASQTYPYSSEYNYDNTGEEAVYMAANMKNDATMMSQCNAKSRADRGQEPVWYFYADPVTICGETWWNFQYTASLAGTILDDWARNHSASPEVDERLAYASKIANISAINSGQIDSNSKNVGTVAWTYQSQPGIGYQGSADSGTLHANWRQMSGEADLGLWGALRILSSDVSNDPIFGTYCYGCDLAQSGTCSTVTPKDGVFKRLNFVSQKLSLALDRDKYTQATVGTGSNYLAFTLTNQDTSATHITTATLGGLAPGSYNVTIDSVAATAVTATSGTATTVPLSITTAATHTIVIAASGVSCQTVGTGGTGSTGGATGAGGAATGGVASNGGTTSTGGLAATGSAKAIGGASNVGGTVAATGGLAATGGNLSAGGAAATGGTAGAGGVVSTGGAIGTTGGAPPVGGSGLATGGLVAVGGAANIGGNVGTARDTGASGGGNSSEVGSCSCRVPAGMNTRYGTAGRVALVGLAFAGLLRRRQQQASRS